MPTPWSPASPATTRPRCDEVLRVIDPKPGRRVIGVRRAGRGGPCSSPTPRHRAAEREELADIADEAAGVARPGLRAARRLLAYSTFGNPQGERAETVREAVRMLDQRGVDFEYEGEMAADVALNPERMAHYPFCRLTGPANVLIMPAFHSAAISTKLLQELGGATVIGPILLGLPSRCRSSR